MLKDRIGSVNDNPFVFTGIERRLPYRGKERLFVNVYQLSSYNCEIPSWVPFTILEDAEIEEHLAARAKLMKISD